MARFDVESLDKVITEEDDRKEGIGSGKNEEKNRMEEVEEQSIRHEAVHGLKISGPVQGSFRHVGGAEISGPAEGSVKHVGGAALKNEEGSMMSPFEVGMGRAGWNEGVGEAF